MLKSGEAVRLIDVREPHEHAAARIDGAELIPMRSIPQSVAALRDDSRIVVFCQHGIRSLQVVNWLRRQGVARCQSLRGGLANWGQAT